MRFAAAILFMLAVCPLSASANDAAPRQQGAASRGSYLVRAGDCASCHSVKGGR